MDQLPPGAREAWEVRADEEEERELCADFSQVTRVDSSATAPMPIIHNHDLIYRKYDLQTLEHNMNHLSLRSLLKTQTLSQEFVIKYLLNPGQHGGMCVEDDYISKEDILNYQPHITKALLDSALGIPAGLELEECPHCYSWRRRSGPHVLQQSDGSWREDIAGTIQCSCTK